MDDIPEWIKKGELLEAKFGNSWCQVLVEGISIVAAGRPRIHVRRLGQTINGNRFYRTHKRLKQIRALTAPAFNGFRANVYADWLEEHDEPAAADKLRRTFPLDDGTP